MKLSIVPLTPPLTAIGVALFAALGLHAASTRDYAQQDHLIACWDGYENADRFMHSGSITEWKDVVGGRAFALKGTVGIVENGLVFDGSTANYGELSANDTAAIFGGGVVRTVEVVFNAVDTLQRILLAAPQSTGVGIGLSSATSLIIGTSATKSPQVVLDFPWAGVTNTFSVVYGSDNVAANAFVNGGQATMDTTKNYWSNNTTITYLGKRSSGTPFSGTIYAVRVYDCELTSADVALNRTIDVERFEKGNVAGNGIVVTVSPQELSSPSPGCGLVDGLEVGETYRFEPPAAGQDNEQCIAWQCTGWTFLDEDGNRTDGTGACDITYEKAGMLTWYLDIWDIAPVAENLPSEYVALEYVESTGDQCILSGVTPTKDTLFLVDYQFTDADPNPNYVFGSYNNGGARFVFSPTAPAVLGYGTAAENTTDYSWPADTGRHVACLSGGVFSVDRTPLNGDAPMTWGGSGKNVCLCAYYKASSIVDYSKMRVYGVTVKSAGAVVRRLVPVMRWSDRVPGLYDLENGAFIQSSPKDTKNPIPLVAGPFVAQDWLAVRGAPDSVGEPDPSYQVLTDVAFGEEYVFHGPAPVTNETAHVRQVCTGWRLACTNGTIVTGQGLEATVTYTEETACSTLYWVFAGEVLPRETVIHVETPENGGDDESGDGSAEHPFATITNALAVAVATDSWSEIVVGEGTFVQQAQYEIKDPILLRGQGIDKTILAYDPNATAGRNLTINSQYARVEGVTLTGGRGYTGWWTEATSGGTALLINTAGGTLADSRVTGTSCGQTHCLGGAVLMRSVNARLEHCVVDGNNPDKVTSGQGGGIRMSAGVVENCLVCNNTGASGGGIALDSADCRVINTTIANNVARALTSTSTPNAGGIVIAAAARGKAQVVNCIIAGNVTRSWYGVIEDNEYDVTLAEDESFAACFDHCAFGPSAEPVGAGAIGFSTDFFTDMPSLDYTLKKGASAIDAGAFTLDLAQLDLYGEPRVQGGRVDIGCAESAPVAFACSIQAPSLTGWGGEPMDFSAQMAGAAAGDALTYAWTAKDDKGVTVATGDRQDFTFAFQPGLYSLELTVTDVTKGLSDTDARPGGVIVNAHDVYVSCVPNDGAAWPYATPETASTNLQETLDAGLAGQVVHLLEGTYVVTQAVEVSTPVVLTGAGVDRTTLKLADKIQARTLLLKSDSCVVSNLTVSGGRGYASWWYGEDQGGCGALIKAGELADARVTGGNIVSRSNGGAVLLAGLKARLTRCVVDDNVGSGGVFANVGTVENCLIRGNTGRAGLMVGANGNTAPDTTVWNCTVVSNSASDAAGVSIGGTLSKSAGRVRNCLFAGNLSEAPNEVGGSEYVVTSGKTNDYAACFLNCGFAAPEPVGEASLAVAELENVGFRRPGRDDWRLRPSSPFAKRGLYGEWMAMSTDLRGEPRVKQVRGGRPLVDIGCYESDPRTGLRLIVR